jgi:hypothetical protein
VVGYGIAACAAAACTANGVSSLRLPAGPTIPTVVVVIEAIRLVGSLLLMRED